MKTKRSAGGWLGGAVLAALVCVLPVAAWGYGGGGGGGGGAGGGGGGSPMSDMMSGGGSSAPVSDPWTQEELSAILGVSVSTSPTTAGVATFSGPTISQREMMEIQQQFNEQMMSDANRDAAIVNTMVKVLEVLDRTGQIAQTGLSWIPGAGMVSSTLLGAARSGADAYRDGKEAREVAVKTLSGGITSAIMSKFSKADEALRNVRRAAGLATSAASTAIKSKAKALIAKAVSIFGAKKVRDSYAEGALGEATEATLNAAADAMSVSNKASVPSYSPGGWTHTYHK
jgi:hypothetical protein